MPTDKRSHNMHKKNKAHKKCGAKIPGSPTPCRHTAKGNGRCQIHRNLTIPLKQKKDAEKKLTLQIKRQQATDRARSAKEKANPVKNTEAEHE